MVAVAAIFSVVLAVVVLAVVVLAITGAVDENRML